MVNEHIAERIADALPEEKNFIEVGPGRGVLTKYLVNREANFIPIEKDDVLAAFIANEYPALEEKIINNDFLKVDLSELFEGERFSIIGNFPYNISTQILFAAIDHSDRVNHLVGMFQREVAQRIASGPGSKVYGITSVLAQYYFDVEYLFKVEKGNFNPPPKVTSAVIRLSRKESVDRSIDFSLLKSIVKMSFQQRRKMMRNTLKGIVKDKTLLEEEIFQRRPESLSVEEFISLTKLIGEKNES